MSGTGLFRSVDVLTRCVDFLTQEKIDMNWRNVHVLLRVCLNIYETYMEHIQFDAFDR